MGYNAVRGVTIKVYNHILNNVCLSVQMCNVRLSQKSSNSDLKPTTFCLTRDRQSDSNNLAKLTGAVQEKRKNVDQGPVSWRPTTVK